MFFSRGFTIMELSIVISIFAILSAVVLFNSGAFSSKVAFENLASDIAINILQAQKEAMSGKFNSLSFGINPPSYGMHFDSTLGNNQKFTYFADLPLTRDMAYNSGIGCSANAECLNEINIQTGEFISSLCVNKKSNNSLCGISSFDIVFTRPLPQPIISSLGVVMNNVLDAEIEITSLKTNDKKTIIVWRTGQISVE